MYIELILTNTSLVRKILWKANTILVQKILYEVLDVGACQSPNEGFIPDESGVYKYMYICLPRHPNI